MIAFIRAVTCHWKSATPRIDADAALRMLRPVVTAYCRVLPWAGNAFILYGVWRAIKGG